MTWLTSGELLAAIRRLPLEERARIIEQATRDIEDDTPSPPTVNADASKSLLGLFADEPDLADAVSAFAYESRRSARMRDSE